MKFNTDYQALAHHWIYNTDYSECYGNRMFSENDKIYSYGHHFLAAEKVRCKRTNEILFVAVNSDSYSVTTSKQMRCVRQAIPQNWTSIYFSGCEWRNSLETLKRFETEYLNAMSKASRARQRKEEYLSDAYHTLRQAKIYFEFSPRAGVKFDKRKLSKFWKDVFNGEKANVEQLQEDQRKRLENERKANARKMKVLHKEELQKLADWKVFKGSTYRNLYLRTINEAHLRINPEFKTVETSQGSSVSIKAAKVLCKMIEAGKDIKGHNIEGFTVISINGTLKIGCHSIPRSEVDRISKELLK